MRMPDVSIRERLALLIGLEPVGRRASLSVSQPVSESARSVRCLAVGLATFRGCKMMSSQLFGWRLQLARRTIEAQKLSWKLFGRAIYCGATDLI